MQQQLLRFSLPASFYDEEALYNSFLSLRITYYSPGQHNGQALQGDWDHFVVAVCFSYQLAEAHDLALVSIHSLSWLDLHVTLLSRFNISTMFSQRHQEHPNWWMPSYCVITPPYVNNMNALDHIMFFEIARLSPNCRYQLWVTGEYTGRLNASLRAARPSW